MGKPPFPRPEVEADMLDDSPQHRPADLLLASLLAFFTFSVAYPAALALGKVLLQTAPARGTVGGRMESFLRAMRDVCLFTTLPPGHHKLTTLITARTSSSNPSSPSTARMATDTFQLRVNGDDGCDARATRSERFG